jgi:hypothetical protein
MKRIRGSRVWARRQRDSKPNSHPEGVEVDATGIWGEGGCVIPGEVCMFAQRLPLSRDGGKNMQKSAEAIVVPLLRDEGLNLSDCLRLDLSLS